MTNSKQYPASVKVYTLPNDAGHIALYTYRSIGAAIVQNFARTQAPESEMYTSMAAFWILEGFLFEINLPKDSYPCITDYLEKRVGLDMEHRFELYKTIDESECTVLITAFNETRQHIFETQGDLPLEEKKTGS